MTVPAYANPRDPTTYRLEARRRVTPRLLEACRSGQLTLDQAAELWARLVVPAECRGRGYLLSPATRAAIDAAASAGVAGLQPGQRRDRQRYGARIPQTDTTRRKEV